jgi:hypothetical protein
MDDVTVELLQFVPHESVGGLQVVEVLAVRHLAVRAQVVFQEIRKDPF